MKLRKFLNAAVLAAAIAGGSANAQQITVEAVGSENSAASFVRPNLFYKIGSVDGYSFVEFYSDDTGYFGKTALSKNLGSRLSATGELVYGSSVPNSAGIGLKYSVPAPKGSYLELKALPLWANGKGYDKRLMTGYFGTVNLPAGFEASSFGEFNAMNTEWGYGEASIGKSFGKCKKFGVHYNPLLKNKGVGRFMPRVEHALRASYKF